MNYATTLELLFSKLPMFQRVGASAYKANLDTTLALSELLGKPELTYRTIHVAGTNGKGSVSHFLASILQESGYKTGLFTSPHLRDFRERIRINGKMIPKKEVIHFVETNLQVFDQFQPSFFEWTFALASSYFASQQVDVAVMETGMGGRLDSTNIISPEISIITNIGYDHMQFLGDTLEKIAREKAGIIKPLIPAVIGETHPETAPVFISVANEKGSPLSFADERYRIMNWTSLPGKTPMVSFEVARNGETLPGQYKSPLTAEYQKKNIATVIMAVDHLRSRQFHIDEKSLSKGLRKVKSNTSLRGRWEILSRKPMIIADIGHNEAGIREIIRQIEKIRYNRLRIVLGVVNDKDIDAMLRLLPAEATYYFCKADIPRGLDAEILMQKALSFQLTGTCYTSVKAALESAKQSAGSDDLILVGGSAFVVAEII